MAIVIFLIFVVFVIGLSLYLGSRTKTSSGYYAAGGKIHWGVNGIAFAGDYLSAASFLGICGMIATVGYDGAVRLYFTENFDKTPIVIRDYSAWGMSLVFNNENSYCRKN